MTCPVAGAAGSWFRQTIRLTATRIIECEIPQNERLGHFGRGGAYRLNQRKMLAFLRDLLSQIRSRSVLRAGCADWPVGFPFDLAPWKGFHRGNQNS